MKTKILFPKPSSCSRRRPALAATLLLMGLPWLGPGLVSTARGASADELLEKGIYLEETKGELEAARQAYQQIAADPSAERSLAAQAQLRLGLVELKLGNKPRAISALEQLTLEFPDKDKLLALIENHMPRVLDEILAQIEQNYLREVDRSELLQTALRAIVGKLDEGSGFLRDHDLELLTRAEAAKLNQDLDQKIAGIGARLRFDEATREVVIETPLPNSPALRAGVRAGDHILEVDGRPLPRANEVAAVATALRGPVGTSVTVGLRRAGSGEVARVKLVRATVALASVLGDRYKPDQSWEFMLDDEKKIGYIRLTHVGRQTPEEMRAALQELQDRGLQGLVLDLRNNPGGMLEEAVATADLFVGSGRILTVKERSAERHYDAQAEGTFSGFPMVLLVDGRTASAAEIIAACLQDQHRATVVGERTFGQGIVRSLIDLRDGVGALKLPVASFYRPNGKPINHYPGGKGSDDWGVKPDDGWEVILSEEERKEVAAARLERDKLNVPEGSPAPAPAADRQLEQALTCLRGLSQRK